MIALHFYIILPFDWEITPNFTRAILCHYKQRIYATMAQNNISHQTKCNISATSGLILKILEAA